MAKRWFKNILRHEMVEKRGNISQVYIDIYISENIEFRGCILGEVCWMAG
jgi:hypothetical protein